MHGVEREKIAQENIMRNRSYQMKRIKVSPKKEIILLLSRHVKCHVSEFIIIFASFTSIQISIAITTFAIINTMMHGQP